ncbi:MAG: HPr family phosphocarrier protein [Treponema sp.]|nr:HPr family phosphocarrier protein [Treponema sp.]
MIENNVKITNTSGLHARPAKRLVELAKSFECDIVIINGTKEGDAKKLIKLLKLGVTCGSEVLVRCTGNDEKEACTAIVELLANITD